VNLKVDDVVLCKVKKIEGTTVFLSVEDTSLSGSMVLSEVAAGRIRNLRQYVSPNRLIVCKVLKISGDHFEFSLRRVTSGERNRVLEGRKKERALRSVLKVVKGDGDKVIGKIKEDYVILDFLMEVKENPKLLEKYLSKEKAGRVYEIIAEKEDKEKVVLRKLKLKSLSEEGVEDVKEILKFEDAKVNYLGSSRFSVSVSGKDFKEANAKMDEVLEEIEKRAGKKKAELEIKKEK